MLAQCILFTILATLAIAALLEPRLVPEDYRLPAGAVEVDNYNIFLDLPADIFEQYAYTGIVTIRFTNVNETNQIKLHAFDMAFEPIQLTDAEGVETTVDHVLDPVTDILTLTAPNPLTAGAIYDVRFRYNGTLRTDEMDGFYLSTYYNGTEPVRLGTTQFQPTSARKAFPCFDEPIYKATFDVSIKHLSIYTPIGNTQGDKVEIDAEFSTTTFLRTPRMSTYLVAFIVSDFTCTNSSEPAAEKPLHRVCSREAERDHRARALQYGPQLIDVMEAFTGIPYLNSTIGKMDEVAIPDFSAGAMENWGLLTYRETGLLWNEVESSNSYLQGLGSVVAHEVVHMWFGNLVTTHWWSDTFLNEGFARLLQYYAFGQVETDWELDKQFVTAVVQPMLVVDAQPSAAALSQSVYTQSEIIGRFGSVSYNKGGSLLRMIRDCIMGATNFETGLRKYLQDNSLGSTTPEILWSALQSEVPQGNLPYPYSLSHVLFNWVHHSGFPVLHVSENGTTVTISQARFVVTGEADPIDKWVVPITYTVSTDLSNFQNTTVKGWVLPTTDLIIENALTEATDWIILNNQQIGFYRIHYSDTLFEKIDVAIKSESFGGIVDLNRAQLVDDVYNLARVGTYEYTRVFEFFKFLENDTSYYPWNSAFRAFSSMLQRTTNEQITQSLSQYILSLMGDLLVAVPFDTADNANQIYTLNRVQANTWACRLGQEECVNKSVEAFANYKNNGIMPDKNLKTIVYCNGLRHSTDAQADWDHLWELYQNATLATEEATILSSLGCSTNRDVLFGYLERSINSTSGIRPQDALSVFSSVYSSNPEGVDIAFEFLRTYHQEILTYYESMNAINNLYNGLTDRFTRQEQITLLEEFIAAGNLGEAATAAATSALANAKANLVLIQLFEDELKTYFNILDTTGTADSLQVGLGTTFISLMMVLYQLWI